MDKQNKAIMEYYMPVAGSQNNKWNGCISEKGHNCTHTNNFNAMGEILE